LKKIKKNFVEVISAKKPLVIFDDFNLYPSIQKEILINLFPVFQINGAKIIIAYNSDENEIENFLSNLKTLFITPFSEENIKEFCEATFNEFFPRTNFKNFI
jgi:hypothetical protein